MFDIDFGETVCIIVTFNLSKKCQIFDTSTYFLHILSNHDFYCVKYRYILPNKAFIYEASLKGLYLKFHKHASILHVQDPKNPFTPLNSV